MHLELFNYSGDPYSEGHIAALYSVFVRDFLRHQVAWEPNKTHLSLRRHPEIRGKHAIFWHVISGGTGAEETRHLEIERCRRIGWIRPLIEGFNQDYPVEYEIKWWISSRSRGNTKRYLLAVNDFEYVVVVDEKSSYAVLVTAYYVEHNHRRQKLRREHDEYWQKQEPPF